MEILKGGATRITDLDLNLLLEVDLPEWLSPAEHELVEEKLQDGNLDVMWISPLAFFAGDEKYYLVQFIRFCRMGSFRGILRLGGGAEAAGDEVGDDVSVSVELGVRVKPHSILPLFSSRCFSWDA